MFTWLLPLGKAAKLLELELELASHILKECFEGMKRPRGGQTTSSAQGNQGIIKKWNLLCGVGEKVNEN